MRQQDVREILRRAEEEGRHVRPLVVLGGALMLAGAAWFLWLVAGVL